MTFYKVNIQIQFTASQQLKEKVQIVNYFLSQNSILVLTLYFH